MEPWEQEWYYMAGLERRQAARPRCRVCQDVLEEIDALLYDGLCRCCARLEEDE